MDPLLIIQIVQLAIGIAAKHSSGALANDAQVASDLVAIVQKAAAAYKQQTGQPLDVALIKPEEPFQP